MSDTAAKTAIPAGRVGYFTDADEALEQIQAIYDTNTGYIRDRFRAFARGERTGPAVSAGYPYIALKTTSSRLPDSRLAYGFVDRPGYYRTTVTRPDLFARYLREQFSLLLQNHGGPLEVGVSSEVIPIHFAFPDGPHVESDLKPADLQTLGDHFDLPDLAHMDDSIVNGTYQVAERGPNPLSLFTGSRIDFSLHRLRHYTATSPEHFQNFVLFTNYPFYIDQFIRYGQEMMAASDDPETRDRRSAFSAFVEPGNRITLNANVDPGAVPMGQVAARMPQMPAYHLKRPDASGITMVNIGVGPSNAKTITDHIAVLRPHAWIMLGHCAGLRNTQALGDYVLAHGYVREDHVLDADLPVWVPVPALAEVQQAMESAVATVTGLSGYELKTIMRTGTVATIDNRNWELRDHHEPSQRLSQSRAIALDMESATIAANGFRFRVPYGTLLCVSDKPLHGQLKLPGMADAFYRSQVDQHLRIGLETMEIMRNTSRERLHSRKLRSFAEVAFQ